MSLRVEFTERGSLLHRHCGDCSPALRYGASVSPQAQVSAVKLPRKDIAITYFLLLPKIQPCWLIHKKCADDSHLCLHNFDT